MTVQSIPKIKSHELILGKNIKVTTDKNSRTRVISLPFDFRDEDESRGVVIICKVKDEEWVPADEIEKIVIHFK